MNDLKSLFRIASYVVMVIAVGIAVYAWAAQAFTLPLGLLAVVAGLAALWLQQEAK